MNKLDSIRRILRDTLQLGDRAQDLTESSALLGAIPELDSMAVVSLITMIEDEFGIVVADDEVTAETFETVGSLVRFVAEKTIYDQNPCVSDLLFDRLVTTVSLPIVWKRQFFVNGSFDGCVKHKC